jgi:TRAP-type C4-dicarboxylate transport system substrate-binding protein
MIQQLMDGTMKMATLGTSTFSKFTSKMEVFQLPFLITDYDKEQTAFTSPEGQVLLGSAEELGLKIVGYMENGIRHFANNKRPIKTPADLEDLKIRIVPSTMLQKSMELLGANPTPLNYGEIYTALQNKVIDGEEINITSLYAMKHYETIQYVSEIGMYPFAAVVVFNLDYWNSLSEEDQQIILDGFASGTEALFDTYLPNYEIVAKQACIDAGLEFNTIEDKEAFRDLVQPVYDEYEAMDPDMKAFIEMMKSLE